MENKNKIEEVKSILNETLGSKAVQITNNELVKDNTTKDDETAKQIAESVNDLLDSIPLEVQEEQLKTNINVGNEEITVGFANGQANDVLSVFGRSIKEVRQMEEILKYAEQSLEFINEISLPIIGTRLTKEKVFELLEKTKGKDIQNASEKECDDIIESAGYKFRINESKLKEGCSILETKRMFLMTIKDFTDGYDQIDASKIEYKKINEDLKDQMEGLLTNIDLMKQLSSVEEQIKEAKTQEEVNQLNEIYQGIFAMVNIGMYINKINTKPINILKREVRRNYDNVARKVRVVMQNDKDNQYLDVKYLLAALNNAFPDLIEENKMFLYVIYKKVIKTRVKKNNNIPTFINYFTLTVSKLINKAFMNDENYKEMRQRIKAAIETFKEEK